MYAPLDASKVMYYDAKTKKGTRLGVKVAKDGSKVRFAKKSGQDIK